MTRYAAREPHANVGEYSPQAQVNRRAGPRPLEIGEPGLAKKGRYEDGGRREQNRRRGPLHRSECPVRHRSEVGTEYEVEERGEEQVDVRRAIE